MPKYSMFELIDALATLIGTSLGIIVGCLIGLILSYAIYSSLDGHGARVESVSYTHLFKAIFLVVCGVVGHNRYCINS